MVKIKTSSKTISREVRTRIDVTTIVGDSACVVVTATLEDAFLRRFMVESFTDVDCEGEGVHVIDIECGPFTHMWVRALVDTATKVLDAVDEIEHA